MTVGRLSGICCCRMNRPHPCPAAAVALNYCPIFMQTIYGGPGRVGYGYGGGAADSRAGTGGIGGGTGKAGFRGSALRSLFPRPLQHRRLHLPDGAGGRGHPPQRRGCAGGYGNCPGQPGSRITPGRRHRLGRPVGQPRHRDGLQQVPEPGYRGQPGGAMGSGAAGHCAGFPEPPAAALRLAIRARPDYFQPGLRGRRHWQQHLRRPFGHLRQDFRPHSGSGCGSGRCGPSPLPHLGTLRTGGQAQRRGIGIGHLPGRAANCPGKPGGN